ncbi:hypothetical protein ACP70R_042647 [Stipagrostis hirtigluma subsp. patula]
MVPDGDGRLRRGQRLEMVMLPRRPPTGRPQRWRLPAKESGGKRESELGMEPLRSLLETLNSWSYSRCGSSAAAATAIAADRRHLIRRHGNGFRRQILSSGEGSGGGHVAGQGRAPRSPPDLPGGPPAAASRRRPLPHGAGAGRDAHANHGVRLHRLRKLCMQSTRGVVVRRQKLVFDGRELARNDGRIRDYGIGGGNVVHLVVRVSDIRLITVETVQGSKFRFHVEPGRTVGYVKHRIAKDRWPLARPASGSG